MSELPDQRLDVPRLTLSMIAAACAAWALVPPVMTQDGPPRKPVSFAVLEDYDKDQDLSEVEADFELFKSLEVHTWRGSLRWVDYEPARGEYDFEWLRRFAELANRHRIELRPYLGYTPEWAARAEGSDQDVWNNPPARIEDWERFAAAIARALQPYPNVRSFEIYHEQNVTQWWDGTPEEYARVLTRGSRAVRGVTSVPVLLGGLVFPDAKWLEAVCGAPGAPAAFSVLPFHAYPETWPPDVTVENYLENLEEFIESADRACGRKAIWINETGFATIPGRSELEQASWWARAIATFLASPRVEHIGIYEIKDLPPDRPAIGDAPNHFGLTRVDRTRKLAFSTVDLLTDLLDTGTLSVDDRDLEVSVVGGAAGELHHHLFGRPDGDRVLILWDRASSPTLRIDVAGRVGSTVEYDLDGRPLDWDETAAVLSRLTLSPGVPRIFRLNRVLSD